MKCIWFFLLLIIVSFYFISCKESNSNQKRIFYSSKTIDIDSTGSQKIYYDIISESQFKIEYNDKKVDNRNTSNTGIIYEFIKDSINKNFIRITYDNFDITLNENGEKDNIFASRTKNSEDRVGEILAKIIGKSLLVKLNHNREIESVTGSEEIKDNILSSMSIYDDATRKTIHDQISRLVGDAFVKNTLAESLSLFPDTTIRVGDSWERNSVQFMDIQIEAVTKYTLKSIDNGVVKVKTESRVKSDGGTKNRIMGMDVLAIINGNQTGEFIIDETSGTLLSNKSSTIMEGVIQILGREIPIEIRMRKEIVGRKLQ